MDETLLAFQTDRQLELFERPRLTKREIVDAMADIRNHYWIIRNTRKHLKSHVAQRRRTYRAIAKIKQRLLHAGVDKRDLLDYLAHCRSQCGANCRFCASVNRLHQAL